MTLFTRLQRAIKAFRKPEPDYNEVAERLIEVVQTTSVTLVRRGGRGVGSSTRRRLNRKIQRAVVRELRAI